MNRVEIIRQQSNWVDQAKRTRVTRLGGSVLPLVAIVSVFSLIHYATRGEVIGSNRNPAKPQKNERARMSDQITIHAAERGNPYINLSDGYDLITPYSGPAELTSLLERNEARPLSLCSADFDEDGVPDLISGYAGPNAGIVTVLRGNVDSIYPNAPEAQQRRAEGTFTDAPFLSPAFVFGVSEAADLIGAGDFDGDGHWDVVTAARGSDRLNLMSGDGKGGLRQTKRIDLPGGVTAMVVGEINRRDGLDDVVVGVSGGRGSQVLVFEGPEGALRANPEVFDLPAEATSLALGQLDDSYEMDLAVAAGDELLIVHGRDRKLWLNADRRKSRKVNVKVRRFSFGVRSIVAGDFVRDHRTALVLLGEDGQLRVISAGDDGGTSVGGQPMKIGVRIEHWRSDALGENLGRHNHATLLCAQASSTPGDDVIVLDPANHMLQVITSGMNRQDDRKFSSSGTGEQFNLPVRLAGDCLTMLPMRLNGDGLSDLVMLRTGTVSPTIVVTQAAQVFTVANTNDSGPGSLRQAIIDANLNPGADAIVFNIPGTEIHTVAPISPLPVISEAVSIDGYSQPGASTNTLDETDNAILKIQLDGSGAGSGSARIGLNITGGRCVIRGLVINRFRDDEAVQGLGIKLTVNGANIVEGNFIGTDPGGNSRMGNFTAIRIENSDTNMIGGTSVAARNIISGNGVDQGEGLGGGNGILIFNVRAVGNQVQGNFVGVGADGHTGLGSIGSNIRAAACPNTLIGGTVPGARNVISDARGWGILIQDDGTAAHTPAVGSMVQGNHIGTDAAGMNARGNGTNVLDALDGIGIVRSPSSTIGGTVISARNIIAGNKRYGVSIGTIQGNSIGQTETSLIGNFIGTNAVGTGPLGNGRAGVFVENYSMSDTIKDNIIAYNGESGIRIPNDPSSSSFMPNPAVLISILSNSIFSNVGLGIDLGPAGPTPNPRNLLTGANNLQNFPDIDSANFTGAAAAGHLGPAVATVSIEIKGSIRASPNTQYTLQFFFGSDCSASQGHQFTGAIPVLIDTRQVATDGAGTGSYDFTLSFSPPQGVSRGYVNATATDPLGNTSELSQCTQVTGTIPGPSPTINDACKGEGKQLIVNGSRFVEGTKVILNGEQEKTSFVSSTQVIAKKAGKRAQTGDTLKVRNPDGSETAALTYTRSNCSP